MNVGQLIEQLKQLNPELMVLVRGYEGGVNEVTSHTLCDVALDANDEWYYGRHEVISDGDLEEYTDVKKVVKGVKLNGNNNI